MADPTTTTAAAVLAGAAAALLELTGVPLPPLVWSFIGAAFLQAYSNADVGRWRAITQVFGGGALGALLGLGGAQWAGVTHSHSVLLLCALGGAGAHPIVQALVVRIARKINDA